MAQIGYLARVVGPYILARKLSSNYSKKRSALSSTNDRGFSFETRLPTWAGQHEQANMAGPGRDLSEFLSVHRKISIVNFQLSSCPKNALTNAVASA